MSREVLLTGFGVRTAFGSGADALRAGVFDGRPAFAPITRFDTSPYRTNLAATGDTTTSLHEVLAEVALTATGMAGLRAGTEATVLVGTAGDFTALTHFWRTHTDTPPAPPGGTAPARGPGGATSAGSPGGARSPGSPGGAVPPGSPGDAASASSPAGTTPPGTPSDTKPPDPPGSTTPPNSPDTTESPDSPGKTAPPGPSGEMPSPDSPGGAASAGSPGGTALPSSPGGAGAPDFPSGARPPGSLGETPHPGPPGGPAPLSLPGGTPIPHGAPYPALPGRDTRTAQSLPDAAVQTVPAWQAEALGDALGVRGPRLAFTNACVASASAIAYGCQLIASGRADVVICAGAYLVEEENLAKFGSGFALSRDGVVRPFCADRSGLLLGDGAAAVVLESVESARRRGARALGALTGWGAASDAHHIARPHPDGTGLVTAARRALRRAGGPRLDYVNAHGTATKTNDPAETRGLHTLFGTDAPHIPVSSTKSTTGHLLEAAGVVELVITLLALRDGVLPPTAGFTEPDPACDLDYVPNRPHKADIRRALTLNAAFGGANTALLLERA